jgi:hypothetical protein
MKSQYILNIESSYSLGDLTEEIRESIDKLLFSLEGQNSKQVQVIRNK